MRSTRPVYLGIAPALLPALEAYAAEMVRREWRAGRSAGPLFLKWRLFLVDIQHALTTHGYPITEQIPNETTIP